ncbi:hypothetical protein RUND412_005715 [Rhizina undulata]
MEQSTLSKSFSLTPLTDFTFAFYRDDQSTSDPPLVDLSNFSTATQIPTNIHLDLERIKAIPDSQRAFNERSIQWLHDQDIVYTATVPRHVPRNGDVCHLVFEGLDTYAEVYLNGKEILSSDNMFISHRVDVTPYLSPLETSELKIVFRSAMRVANRIMEENGGKRVTWNGHYCRNFVRKAQFHFGWDWGPCLVTCGPWKPIYLDIHISRMSSVQVLPRLSPDLKRAFVEFRVAIEKDPQPNGTYFVTARVTSPGPNPTQSGLVLTSPGDIGGFYTGKMAIDDPLLWYPKGYGEQPLYEVEIVLTSSEKKIDARLGTSHRLLLDRITKTIGLRKVRLVRDPLPEIPDDPVSGGSTFYFEINNTPIFMGGSNWIPGDSFLPRFTREKTREYIELLSGHGNQNMIRVWGGGIYESEDFYDICDELGVLVWQDITLACGDYPAHQDWFVESISKEVKQNLERLRWHPSLIIVAGNNEDYQVADEELGYDHNAPEETWRSSAFPGRWLYEKIFPKIVTEVCNGGYGAGIGDSGEEDLGGAGMIYWPGSPWGGEDSTDRTVVWGGIQAPYQRFKDLGGRFVSEFGMISYPDVETIDSGFLPPESDEADKPSWQNNPQRHTQSEVFEHHTKAHSFEKRHNSYITENFRIIEESLEERVHVSQLLQSEAMKYAFTGWRRKWAERKCGGALVWQANDVWPATSWSIISHSLIPKPAFYAISRALQPVILILNRRTTDPKPNSKVEALVSHKTSRAGQAGLHSTPHIYPVKKSEVEVYLSNISAQKYNNLEVEIYFIDNTTGHRKLVQASTRNLAANSGEVIAVLPVPEESESGDRTPTPTVLYATVRSNDGALIAREVDWPQPLKYLTFQDRDIQLEWVQREDGDLYPCVEVKKPVKGLVFTERKGEMWRLNAADLVPGEKVVFEVKGKREREVGWRALGCVGGSG